MAHPARKTRNTACFPSKTTNQNQLKTTHTHKCLLKRESSEGRFRGSISISNQLPNLKTGLRNSNCAVYHLDAPLKKLSPQNVTVTFLYYFSSPVSVHTVGDGGTSTYYQDEDRRAEVGLAQGEGNKREGPTCVPCMGVEMELE